MFDGHVNIHVRLTFKSIRGSCSAFELSLLQIPPPQETIAGFLRNYAINGCMIVTFFLCVVITHFQMDIPGKERGVYYRP